MAIPQELQLSAEDIRYLRPIQLSTLTGFHPTYFSAWSSSRHLSERSLGIIASALGVDKAVVLAGFELRRTDVAQAKQVEKKAEQLISYLNAQKEPA